MTRPDDHNDRPTAADLPGLPIDVVVIGQAGPGHNCARAGCPASGGADRHVLYRAPWRAIAEEADEALSAGEMAALGPAVSLALVRRVETLAGILERLRRGPCDHVWLQAGATATAAIAEAHADSCPLCAAVAAADRAQNREARHRAITEAIADATAELQAAMAGTPAAAANSPAGVISRAALLITRLRKQNAEMLGARERAGAGFARILEALHLSQALTGDLFDAVAAAVEQMAAAASPARHRLELDYVAARAALEAHLAACSACQNMPPLCEAGGRLQQHHLQAVRRLQDEAALAEMSAILKEGEAARLDLARLLRHTPDCPAHGPGCVRAAVRWLETLPETPAVLPPALRQVIYSLLSLIGAPEGRSSLVAALMNGVGALIWETEADVWAHDEPGKAARIAGILQAAMRLAYGESAGLSPAAAATSCIGDQP